MLSCSLDAGIYLLWNTIVSHLAGLQCAVLCDLREASLHGRIMAGKGTQEAEQHMNSSSICLYAAGLNMLNQARDFNETVPLSGLVLTKLDGTARGGAVVSVVDELRLPVKFIGVGETVDDLQPFDAQAFVNSLFPEV